VIKYITFKKREFLYDENGSTSMCVIKIYRNYRNLFFIEIFLFFIEIKKQEPSILIILL